MKTLLDNLVAALPLIARLCGGGAILTDREGYCLASVDRHGNPVENVETQVLSFCHRTAESGATQGMLDNDTQVEQLAIPIDGYVLFASNISKIERRNEFFNVMKETLPLIARVAGGEAVLFDKDGRRMLTADPNATQARVGPGTVSEPCRDVMRRGRPNIGASRLIPGAMAVRIPINPSFGFGFNNAAAVRQKERLLDQVKNNRTAKYSWDDIVGHSLEIQRVMDLAKRAAQTHSSIILQGESGTGKELFAQAIHNASSRSAGPFIAINCSAIPESLVESTLFGYEQGTFTGAQKGGRAGLFEQACGGTLLLDEITEMPHESQAKLLRVLQEHEVCRIGSTKPIPIDVRVVCTSNRDLGQYVEAARFRRDLFYRLNVIDIRLPPLRARKEDIPEIARHIIDRICRQSGRFITDIETEVMEKLCAHSWPGNCRELHNVLERAINLTAGETLRSQHISGLSNLPPLRKEASVSVEESQMLTEQLAEAEESAILAALKRHRGRKIETAKELGISTTTLWRRLKRMQKSGHSDRFGQP